MQEKQTPAPCRTSSFSAADFLARLSALQDPEKDSEIRAALSSLNWPAWLKRGSLRISCLKMYPVCYLMTAGGHLQRSLTRWTDWGMAWNGNVGCLPGVFRYPNPQNRIHVTEKPLQLMRDVVQICEPGGRILDPFAGAGTTVLAAVQEGYEAVGIEMSDAYFQRSAERLKTALAADENAE